MPKLEFGIVRAIVGARMVRVPVSEILDIRIPVKLRCTAQQVGFHRTEDKVRALQCGCPTSAIGK